MRPYRVSFDGGTETLVPLRRAEFTVKAGSWQVAVKRAGDLYASRFHTGVPPRTISVRIEAVSA